MTKLHVFNSIVTYTQNKMHEKWSIAYLNNHTDSLRIVSDASPPTVDRELADFVCDFSCLLGSAGGKQIINDQFFFRSADCLWDLASGLESTDRLLTFGRSAVDGRLTLCQLLFSKLVIQTWLTVNRLSGDSRPSAGR